MPPNTLVELTESQERAIYDALEFCWSAASCEDSLATGSRITRPRRLWKFWFDDCVRGFKMKHVTFEGRERFGMLMAHNETVRFEERRGSWTIYDSKAPPRSICILRFLHHSLRQQSARAV
jgi:hypothetical protein